jgi:hypothetical protein
MRTRTPGRRHLVEQVGGIAMNRRAVEPAGVGGRSAGILTVARTGASLYPPAPYEKEVSVELLIVLLLILGAEFVNGWTDAPNAIATCVGTRALSPRQAIALASIFNLAGVFSGTAVAATIGKGIIDPGAINLLTVGGAMVGLILWSTLAARVGIPTSETHALVAGLAGAGLATAGPSVLLWEGWKKVLIGLAFSSLLGFGAGGVPDARGVLALPQSRTGEGPRTLPLAADFLIGLHGLQSDLPPAIWPMNSAGPSRVAGRDRCGRVGLAKSRLSKS